MSLAPKCHIRAWVEAHPGETWLDEDGGWLGREVPADPEDWLGGIVARVGILKVRWTRDCHVEIAFPGWQQTRSGSGVSVEHAICNAINGGIVLCSGIAT